MLQDSPQEGQAYLSVNWRRFSDKPQSWVCRHERGDLRMDYMELRAYLKALDVSVVSFVSALERKLGENRRRVTGQLRRSPIRATCPDDGCTCSQ